MNTTTDSQVSNLKSEIPAAPRPPVTCIILAYNEAARIRFAVTHALQWADEVVVVDKSSTDDTREIATSLGARVAVIPFSRQGFECIATMVAQASHDWVWVFTPGEVPTKGCIAAGLRLVGDSLDLVYVPMHYFSFGIHHPASPWAGGHHPRLYHRQRVTFTGRAHDALRAQRVAKIEYGEDCFVLHQTHATAESFMRSHTDYMAGEAALDTPEVCINRAIRQSAAYDQVFRTHPDLLPHQLAWKLYWYGVALHAWERATESIPEAYRRRAQEMLTKEWFPSFSPPSPSAGTPESSESQKPPV